MANIFTNASGVAGTSLTDICTAPVGKVSLVHGVYLANVSESVVLATLKVGSRSLLSGVPIAPHSTLIPEKVVNLKAGEKLQVSANVANSLEYFASIVERG